MSSLDLVVRLRGKIWWWWTVRLWWTSGEGYKKGDDNVDVAGVGGYGCNVESWLHEGWGRVVDC